jgi:hypothetical protein
VQHRAVVAAIVVAVVAYGWWATALAPFSRPAFVAILAPGAVLLVVAPHRTDRPSLRQWYAAQRAVVRAARLRSADPAARGLIGGLVTWAVLVGAFVMWQLTNFVLSPRSQHPTVSSMLDAVETHPVRVVMFALWIALGWDMARA